MSGKKDEEYYENDEDEDTEEDVKCLPEQVPWSNPNEEWASHKAATSHKHHHHHHKHDHHKDKHEKQSSMESSKRRTGHGHIGQKDQEAVAMQERASFEAKEKIQEENNPQNLVAEEEIGIEYPDTSVGQRVVSPSRRPDVTAGAAALGCQGHHHPFIFEERRPGAVVIPGIDVNEGYEEQATVATRDDLTVNVFARVVDTEEEKRRLRDQERMRHELGQAVHERDQLRRIVDNAVVVTPLVATNKDVELGNEEVAQGTTNTGDLSESDIHSFGTRGRRWFVVGAILLIAVAVTVALALVLPSEPTLEPSTQEPPHPTPQDLSTLLSSVSSDGGESLQTPKTPQNMALNWLAVNNTNLGIYTNQTIIQRYALATLYFSTNGDSWESNALWLDNGNECSWWQRFSDPCTDTGAVVDLNLSWNDLAGMIPPEIGLLPDLETLYLHDNALEGNIPTEIGQLKQLSYLDLINNNLSGTIPSEIGLLSDLETLNLDSNTLEGNIPTEIGQLKQLSFLAFHNNSLSGTIPSEMWLLSNLELLSLSFNALEGNIPTEIGQLKQLHYLHLYTNSFSGTIPSEIGLLSDLVTSYFDSNALEGTIPTEIGQLKQLIYIYLSSNSLSGMIPSEIGLLSNLLVLYLHYNALQGMIPTEIGQLNQLTSLYVSNNALNGTIPSEINSLFHLDFLWLFDNMFTGNYTCPDFIDTCYISCDNNTDPACRSLG